VCVCVRVCVCVLKVKQQSEQSRTNYDVFIDAFFVVEEKDCFFYEVTNNNLSFICLSLVHNQSDTLKTLRVKQM